MDEAGEQLGVLNTREAIRMARERGLDLVEVAATANPPVCRIIDFGKFQYEAKKKANEAKKKQVTIQVKEVKFRPGTDDHDYDFKMRNARRWLAEGDKVKATIFFRGREITHRELGTEVLRRLEDDLKEQGEVEQRPRMEGNQMYLIFTPKKTKTAKPQPTSATPNKPATTPAAKPAPVNQNESSQNAQSDAPPAVESAQPQPDEARTNEANAERREQSNDASNVSDAGDSGNAR